MSERPMPEALSEFIKAFDYEDNRRPQRGSSRSFSVSKSFWRAKMSKRPIPEQIEIIETCIKAIWRELEDDERYDAATDHLSDALDDLTSARQELKEAGL